MSVKMARQRSSLVFEDHSLTKQAFAEESDINNIIAKCQKTGFVNVNPVSPRWLDCSNFVDFRAAQDLVIQAQQSFDALPASMRARFANDSAQYIDFISNPANTDELIALGLLPKPQQEASVVLSQDVQKSDEKIGA